MATLFSAVAPDFACNPATKEFTPSASVKVPTAVAWPAVALALSPTATLSPPVAEAPGPYCVFASATPGIRHPVRARAHRNAWKGRLFFSEATPPIFSIAAGNF